MHVGTLQVTAEMHLYAADSSSKLELAAEYVMNNIWKSELKATSYSGAGHFVCKYSWFSFKALLGENTDVWDSP